MAYKQDPMNALPDRARTQAMLERMEFVARHRPADERHGVVRRRRLSRVDVPRAHDPLHMLAGIWPVVVMRQQVVPPLHDTKPNLEIMQGLAKRLGLSDYFDYTIEQWVEAQAEELPSTTRSSTSSSTASSPRRTRRSTARP